MISYDGSAFINMDIISEKKFTNPKTISNTKDGNITASKT